MLSPPSPTEPLAPAFEAASWPHAVPASGGKLVSGSPTLLLLLLLVLLTMTVLAATSAAAGCWLLAAGTYGLLWCWKSQAFPDRQWEQPVSLWYGVGVIWGALSLYWVAPYLIVSRRTTPPPAYLGMCVALFGLGVFLHFASDMQKHVELQLRPGKLITDKLWARCRNPNYLGELLIYLGFQLLAMHWVPLLCLGLMVCCYWVPNMLRKDASLARYPEFAAWKARSWMIIPGIF